MIGVLLAGGCGTRLHPTTLATSKHLLCVYDKPMIYYPLDTLLKVGVRDILVVVSPQSRDGVRALLGNGHRLGVRIEYVLQAEPKGVADALLTAGSLIDSERVVLVLGDNFFADCDNALREAVTSFDGCTILGKQVEDPENYAVVLRDSNGSLRLTEKPSTPQSDYAVPGFYVYDKGMLPILRKIALTADGTDPDGRELEITTLNKIYAEEGRIRLLELSPETRWLDMGTPRRLLEVSMFVDNAIHTQERLIGAIELTALENRYITRSEFLALARSSESPYHKALQRTASA